MTSEETEAEWRSLARPGQLPPDGNWRDWTLAEGRGWGKTRAAAEEIARWARKGSFRRILLIGPTRWHIDQIMTKGPSGILACSERTGDQVVVAGPRLKWANGSTATTFTAAGLDMVRGHSFDGAWVEHPELCRTRGLLFETVRASLADNPKSRLIVTTAK